MSLFASSAYSASRSVSRSYPALATAGPRSFASSSRLAAPKASAPTSEAAPASSPGPAKTASTLPPSSCPAGTPLPGLAILKDRPEPIALPDEEYPPWLWSLLSTSAFKTTSASTDASDAGPSSGASGAALTKGQLRVQQKRELREKRAANAAAARAAAAAGALMGKGSKAAAKGTAPPTTSEEMATAEASVAQEERDKKLALRKANREAIKSRNFVKAA